MKYFIIVAMMLLSTLTTADAKSKHKLVRSAAPTDEAVCMAQAIYHEAKSESLQGKIAVGKVIMNRIDSPGYASTVCGVVYERCQFAFTCRRHKQIDWANNADLIELSRQVIAGQYEDYSRGAISFNNKPFKNRGLVKTAKIGNHYFYKSYARAATRKEDA